MNAPHLRQLSILVLFVVLDDAERVNPYVFEIELPDDLKGAEYRLGQACVRNFSGVSCDRGLTVWKGCRSPQQ
ncbi:hypothetical protein N657DRAFT_714296 [Parathielavia appendiculata]|uniref:Uncharacterized protein n=1 Tax=Parathielavia appendiculata TaxID=2587402 RepID=A0AAN6Z424_9PEZI|nr:hypothetical protein N657DRAFT_714296 [Parathielavia appendiculata]